MQLLIHAINSMLIWIIKWGICGLKNLSGYAESPWYYVLGSRFVALYFLPITPILMKGPFYQDVSSLTQHGLAPKCPEKRGIKLLIHSKTSMVSSLVFGNV